MSGPVEPPRAESVPSDRSGDDALPAGGLGHVVSADHGDRPAVTLVDRRRGERTELGCATLANWADKTANLLVEDLELSAGDELTVDLGSHWTTLVILMGAWRAGVVVRLGHADPAHGPAAVHERRVDGPVSDDVLVVGDGMAGRPLGDVDGGLSFPTDVLAMPDEFPVTDQPPEHPALAIDDVVISHAALGSAGWRAARLLGLSAGSRLASARPVDAVDGLVAGALAAWCADASLVLATDPDSLGDVASAERAEVVLGGPADHATAIDIRCELAADGTIHVSC